MSSATVAATQDPIEPTNEPTSAPKPELIRVDQDVKEGSPKAVQGGQRPILLQIDSSHAENSGSKIWQLLTIIVPVLLTGWLTFVSSHTENTIKKDIDDQNQILSAQLDLTKDLYKRRFDAYEKLYAQLIVLNDKLSPQYQEDDGKSAQVNGQRAGRLALWKRQTADLQWQLYELNEMNGLHMSPEVGKLMGEAWLAGVRGNTAEIGPKIHKVEMQMRSELERQMVREQETQRMASTNGSRGNPQQNREK